MLTKFIPGHDARLASADTVDVELHFSEEMTCGDVTDGISIISRTADNTEPKISGVTCSSIPSSDVPAYGAYIPSTWRWKATLTGVSDGVHSLTLKMTASDDTTSTDHLMFRVGQPNNPIVFPQTTNYSTSAYTKTGSNLAVTHSAAGADYWRYSTNWASTWSTWMKYTGGKTTIQELPWKGTKRQEWSGDHIIVQYWSKLAGSSDHIVQADADWGNKPPRRFPHIFLQGDFNNWGYDGGVPNTFQQEATTGISRLHVSTEWGGNTSLQMNVWGMNPDGKPDQGFIYGDVDNDTILDRQLPASLASTVINITGEPPSPYLAYRVELNEGK